MHLQLTGRETDLEGYWRLGGVATTDDEGVQRVYDFGVNANHGVVYGTPYGGGITLDRKLGDGTILATRYSNDELFAVSEGATYVETFEFRTDPAVDPKNVVNSSNGHIFKPALWGRLSRTAEDKQEFNPLSGENYQFESMAEGWHRATCRFIVPQGVRLVRCFEVSNVQGNWNTLEVRRHSVKLVSDTVTRSDADETANLNSLAGVTAQNDPVSKLPELEAKEKEEAPLITRKKELDAAIAALADIPGLQSQRDAQKTKVDDLSAQVNTLENTYNTELNNPLNYWCKIVAKHSGKCLDIVGNLFEVAGIGFDDQTLNLLGRDNFFHYYPTSNKEDKIAIVQSESRNTDSQKWSFEPIENGYYRIKSKHSQKYLDVSRYSQENFAIIWQYSLANVDNQKWLLENIENKTYKIKAKHSGKYLDVYYQSQNNFASIIQHNWLGSNNQKWKIEKVGEEKTNSNIDNAYKAWQAKLSIYNAENATLTNLNKRLADTSRGDVQLREELRTVTAKLQSVQGVITTLTTTYLNLVSQANSTAQSMTDLPNQADPRGLKVQGALLPFAQAATRLHALESCTGRVTLSYQDSAGNLRQTHYDSAYDADGKGEQWLPEGYRVAVKLDGTKTAPSLPPEIFNSIGGQITIEFWAKGGDALPKDVTFLGARNANATCLRIQLPNEKGEVVWEVGSPSGNATIDRLQVLTEVRFYRENWTHWAFVKNCDKGEMCIYRNGKLFHKNDPKAKENPVVFRQPIVGVTQAKLGGLPGSPNANWSGKIAELRIWNVALGERELETNSLLTLSGDEPGLVAYYPMNEATGNDIRDLTGTAAHKLTIADAVWTPCTAPIGRFDNPMNISAPIGTEYSRVVVDPQRRKTAMMMRCLALVEPGGVRLFDEQRIEELEMKWIGNAQIDPTLIGYIEGAPPLPSENLTESDNYSGATSVELIQSSDVSYSWTREQDASLGSEGEAMLGFKSQTSGGLGIVTSMEDTDIGAGVKMNYAYHWQNASNVGAGQSLSQSNKLELRGNHEQDACFPHLGKRFVPKNVGYALVTSGLADVFVSKLRKSGRMVGYQVLPVEGVPIDVNTITFMINPAYIMAGSLDGMTGTQATSQRVFGQVPEMRAQYGSLYPASYFRLQEAYDLKTRIDNQDRQHQAYFNQFNAGLVDETSLNDQTGGPNMTASSSEMEALKEQIKTKNAEIKNKNTDKKAEEREPNPVQATVKRLGDEIEMLEDEVKELEAQKQELMEEEQEGRQGDVEKRQQEIEAVHSDLSAREHASTSFAAWQRTMESLQIRAGKRNIVNTYIWDADGGFHAQEQQFASTVEHSIGGSFDLSTALGARAEVAISKVMVGSSVYATTKLTQTMSKKEAGSKGMELRVNLDGVESRGITDYRDYPILPGEKVDRYRFMSFFLEKNVDHWHDFFNQVVDPEWLASNDEEARALRQTQNALPNQVWRVLHRVTYVERPALMGFGRQQPARVQVADEMQKLRSQVSELSAKLEGIDSKLNRLLEGK